MKLTGQNERQEKLHPFEFPLLPIEEQKRIAEILWAADEAVESWLSTSISLEVLKQQILGSTFTENMISIGKWKLKKLKDIASLQTGIAKGRKYAEEEQLTELPYLRVANVKDGYLDLSEIKKISVSTSEIDRYSIRPGDVLITEGGDFDKVGRGTVWNAEIEECLHQNHVFCVRPKNGILLSKFLSYQTASPYGKRYFLKCAKKTSNLASINSTQVKNFPVLLAPFEEQQRLINLIKLVESRLFQTNEHIVFLRKLIRSFYETLVDRGEPHV